MKLAVWMGILSLWVSWAQAESVILNIGETRRLPLGNNARVWVQNKKPLVVSNSGKSLVITGHSEGDTVINIGDQVYQVQVLHPMKKTLGREFAKQLRQSLGLNLAYSKSQVRITGRLFSWQDWLLLAEAARRYDTKYVMAANIPSQLQAEAQHHWQEEEDRLGLPTVPVHFSRDGLEARLAVDNDVFKKYEKILSPFGILLEKDKNAIDIAPVVRVQITVAEIRRDFATKYGIEWPDSYSATVVQNSGPLFDDLVFTAHALETQGKGKILASPTILCRSGKEAEFLAGGEFPIKIINFRMQDVVWKKYGVILKVQPKADSSGRMSIALQTEVSTLDTAHTVDGIPGILSNSISSHFDLTKPQTIALSGLIKNEESQTTQGLPLLSRLPILGALFSSREFQENRSELVIFVRPSIMKEDQTIANSQVLRQHMGDVSHE